MTANAPAICRFNRVMSKLQSCPYAGQAFFGTENRNTVTAQMLRVSGSRIAISRRDSASHADEIIIRLNWHGGAIFTFFSLKGVNCAQFGSRKLGTSCMNERPCTSISGLQFFTISVFKPRCDQLKVLTGLEFSSGQDASRSRERIHSR